jgi:hypothetical protein
LLYISFPESRFANHLLLQNLRNTKPA